MFLFLIRLYCSVLSRLRGYPPDHDLTRLSKADYPQRFSAQRSPDGRSASAVADRPHAIYASDSRCVDNGLNAAVASLLHLPNSCLNCGFISFAVIYFYIISVTANAK